MLVTGGTGFIGRPLVERLSASCGFEVVVPSRHRSGGSGNVQYLKADLTDESSVAALGEEVGEFDGLVCLMSLIPQPRTEDPGLAEYVRQNIGSAIRLLPLLERCKGPVVYVSTLDVYGTIKDLPVTESHPTAGPFTDYGMTKLASEMILDVNCRLMGLPLKILRLSQVYGPGEPPIKAIPSFIKEIVEGRAPVVYGDGSDLRDYVYVDDVVSAIVVAVEGGCEGVYNISGGRPMSIKDVLDRIIEISGTDIRPRFEPRRKDRMDIYFDITRAETGLGWSPGVDMETGLEREYRYFSSSRRGSRDYEYLLRP